jgi:ABC-type nitrate/sulfonate/bicarbonate transport system substrate-binding protein
MGAAGVGRAADLPSINLQLQNWTAIAQEKGFFKEEFDKVGVRKVNLIATGVAELIGAESAAVGGGALAIAQRMIYPALVHRSNGLDAVIIWESEPSNRYRAPILASASNQAINNVQDLEGKRFGSSRISCYWSSPFEILTKAGLPLDSRLTQGRVRYQSIDVASVAAAALLSGQIDATATHPTTIEYASLILNGKVKVVARSPDDGIYVKAAGRVAYFARSDFAEKYPEVVRAFLIARDRTRTWSFAHLDEAAAIVADKLRIPVEVAKFQIADQSQFEFLAGEPDAETVRRTLKEFQEWYVANGDDILVDHKLSDEQIRTFVDARFFARGKYSIYD